MAQQTNLNVSPYFDDFNASNDYYRVLFKPGYPVQARELTGLQSTLQNQIAKFGQHMFKEGAKVIPGNTNYNRHYAAIEINGTHLGVPVESYIDQLLDTKIVGLQSGITAVINKVLKAEDSERDHLTLYVKYHSSNITDNHLGVFGDGELLASDSDIISGPLNNAFIPSGESFASAVSSNAASEGTSFSVSEGVYFIRGTFVNVSTETLIASQYTNTPTGRLGLRVTEETINSDEDPNLTDNSKGFNNYAAPGADRLKITCSLMFKEDGDFNDDNFVQLAEVKEGELISHQVNTEYSILADELARRTYAESGDYTVKPFRITVRDSLNNGIANNGVFSEGQLTDEGTLANEDLGLYEVTPGKGFVKGYEIEKISTTLKDVLKPRTTKTLEGQSVNYKTGATLTVNSVTGSPTIGIGNTYILSLRDQRVGVARSSAGGSEIGLARVYDAALESGSYSTSNSNTNEWDLALYDVQTYTTITLNEAITLNTPQFVKGKYSGATGFLRSNTTTDAITLYETAGTFSKNEPFLFNGIENSRVAVAVTSYGMGDVKSVYGGTAVSSGPGSVGTGVTFTADTVQANEWVIGDANMTSATGTGAVSISTITSGNPLFPGSLKKNQILKFGGLGNSDQSYVRITAVNTSNVVVTGVTTVSGVVEGALYKSTAGTTLQVPDLTLVTSPFAKNYDNTLYTPMPKPMISDVDLTDSYIRIRKTQEVTISHANDKLTAVVQSGSNETFLPFDEERYSLIRSDGHTEILNSSKFSFNAGMTELQLEGIGSDLAVNRTATLITTLSKSQIKAKVKRKKRINTIVIDKSRLTGSGIGATTLNDGLDYHSGYAYGTRVQDEKISLNIPDLVNILGIFESADTSEASAPKLTLTSIDGATGKTGDLIIGEKITGESSGVIAVYAEQLSDSQISYTFRNDKTFTEGETISFAESNVKAVITTIDEPSMNVGSSFKFNTGQKGTFYGYGFITRKNKAKAPAKQLKVYFMNAYYDSADDGDITTKNSYDSFNYNNEIASVNGVRNTDIIDIRPRVSSYTPSSTNSRSPLEFLGRTFDQSGNSAANILASDEAINTNYSFYLGRMDRIYLTKGGEIKVVQGTPAENPELPVRLDDGMELATTVLPPYLLSTSEASISFLKHKRYRMRDIRKLEERIQNLEYYTSMSLLETATENMFIPDANGLNKFKSGFFVDNFTSFKAQELATQVKNSIDATNKEARPSHYTNAVDLQIGPVEGNQSTMVYPPTPEGTGIKRTGDVITLDYEEVAWQNQPFGTRTESVTPFLIALWRGDIELTPASDTWVDTVRLETQTIRVEGSFAHAVDVAARQFGGWDPQTGLTPIVWNGWETAWTGTDNQVRTRERTETDTRTWSEDRVNTGNDTFENREWTETTNTTFRDTTTDTFRTGMHSRNGNRLLIQEQWDNFTLGDRTISEEITPYMRSRNIAFDGSGFKPLTRLYAFFNREKIADLITPKLLEIEMISGTFQVGETVWGNGTGFIGNAGGDLRFRVAQANHKEGPYNAPTRVYSANPYTSSVGATQLEVYTGLPGSIQLGDNTNKLPESYSSTSTIVNVDTISMANEVQGDWYGYIAGGPGMKLKGLTSGAEAKVVNQRLISDYGSTVQGSFFLPSPHIATNPKWASGTQTFTLVDQSDNHQSCAETLGEENYESSGTIETVQENIISVRNHRQENIGTRQERAAREFVSTNTESDVIGSTSNTTVRITDRWTEGSDPLAQSFSVSEPTGVFVTSCDVYFGRVSTENLPVIFELRPMVAGVPSTKVLPFSKVLKNPAEITASEKGDVATRFNFKAPVYLEGGMEYAIVLQSQSNKYSVFISRVGENDLITDEFVSQQPFFGSLFKSQNGSSWDPSQWEDMKFTLNRAKFETEGTLQVYSPILSEGNKQVPKLMPDSINLQSKKIRVGLGTTVAGNTQFHEGVTVSQTGSKGASGNLVGFAGSLALAAMNVINAGYGYTNGTVTGVGLTNITGNGSGMTATVVVSAGVIDSATVTGVGVGYQVGDVLAFNPANNGPGIDAQISVVSLGSTNQIILDNVQGDFVTGAGTTLLYDRADTGITTQMNWGAQRIYGATLDIVTVDDGLHFTVDHKNHGMHHETNRVTLSNILSDVIPTKLNSPYNTSSTTSISVSDSSEFSTFENVSVASTNLGYALIGQEIVSYSGASGNTLTGVTRNVDSTQSMNYIKGQSVYKYELGGVSLRRFNKTHILSEVGIQTTTNPITFDSYTIRLDTAISGTGRSDGASFPALFMNENKSSGGNITRSTQNMPFEVLNPQIQNMTVPGTSINAEVRTVSGTSLNTGSGQGSDLPFADKGYEAVALNENNYLDSPRIIASRINETSNSSLTDLAGDRSMNLSINLNSENDTLSPVIDTQRMSAILTSNRVDNMVSNYITDGRVDNVSEDPNSFQYLSKENVLETSATSIKIMFDAHINDYNDVRAFYAISDQPAFDPVFSNFPGYENLNERGEVVDSSQNNGHPDSLVPKTDPAGFTPDELAYREYSFTINNLPSFKAFRIKLDFTSTNQAFVPRMQNLRVITLA